MLKPVTILVAFSFFSFLISCGHAEEERNIYSPVTSSLKASFEQTKMSTASTLLLLEEKTTRQVTMERSLIWFPLAKRISSFSSAINDTIIQFSKRGIFNSESCRQLFAHLTTHAENILAIHPNIDSNFRARGIFLPASFMGSCSNADEFFNRYFKKSDTAVINAVISGIQNDIAIIENETTRYCLHQTSATDEFGLFSSFSAIVGQNSNILKPGDILEIIAGVGSFSKSAQPEILINGKYIPMSDAGYSSYKTKVSNKPGDYKLPVTIKYYNQETGDFDTKSISLEYTVAKPCADQ
jgi:hypothetical protein